MYDLAPMSGNARLLRWKVDSVGWMKSGSTLTVGDWLDTLDIYSNVKTGRKPGVQTTVRPIPIPVVPNVAIMGYDTNA